MPKYNTIIAATLILIPTMLIGCGWLFAKWYLRRVRAEAARRRAYGSGYELSRF